MQPLKLIIGREIILYLISGPLCTNLCFGEVEETQSYMYLC